MIDTDVLFRLADAAEEAGDYSAARDGFERCAALGSLEGLTRLAYMHDVGLGAPADKPRAMQHYRRAWRARSPVAANNIAILYRERGDPRAMFRWFLRAAEAGDGDAWVEVARCYQDGVGVRKSIQAAMRCLAAAMGSDWISEAGQEEAADLMEALRPRLA